MTTFTKEFQQRLLEQINGVLQERTRIEDERQKRKTEANRKYGVPIVGVRSGSNRGYFIPANKAELMDGTKAFYNQLQDEQKRLTILVNADPAIYTELIKELLEGV